MKADVTITRDYYRDGINAFMIDFVHGEVRNSVPVPGSFTLDQATEYVSGYETAWRNVLKALPEYLDEEE